MTRCLRHERKLAIRCEFRDLSKLRMYGGQKHWNSIAAGINDIADFVENSIG